MKKVVNDPTQFVPEMLAGLALANPDTRSGHEPAHVMIVGSGVLDAACPGNMFAAPPMEYVLETSKLYLLYGRAHQELVARGISVGRNYVGEYRTSLDMAGASLTLVKLDDDITSLLAAPAAIPIRTS